MNMTIAPAVALAEARADDDYRRQRALVLRQSLDDALGKLAAVEKERDDLKAQLAEQASPKPKTADPVSKKKGGD